jgi:hypothetical protein
LALETDTPTEALRAAAEAHDAAAFVETLAPDVVLRSPITTSFAFHGRAQLQPLMEDVFSVVSDIRYTADVGDDRHRVLRAEARVGGQQIVESVIVTLDDDGLVSELELFVRPMPGLVALAAALGPRLARRRGRPRAAAVRAMIGPLAFMTGRGERLAAKLARP